MRPAWLSCRAAAVALLVVGAAGFGLFFHGDQDIFFAPSLLLLFAAALLALLGQKQGKLPRGSIAGCALALWAYLAISMLWSSVPYASLLTWLVFSALPVGALALGAETLTVPTLLAALSFLGGFAVLQIAVWPQLYGFRAHAPLLDANNLAALLNLGLLPTLAFMLRSENLTQRRIAAVAAAFIFAGLLATQSRAGLLAAFVAAVPLILVLRPSRGTVIAAGCGAALMTGICLAVLRLRSPARYALLLQPGDDANVTARLALWRGAWRLIQAHPWRGTGFGTFYLYYPSVRVPLLDNSTGAFAHNDLLQFWAEAGIAAPLLALTFAGAAAGAAYRTMRMPSLTVNQRAECAGLACGLLAAGLHSLVEFQFYVLPVLIVSGVWLARLGHHGSFGETHTVVWRPPFRLPLIASGVALPLILLTLSCGAGQIYFQRAQAALAAGHVGAFLDATARAEKIAPASYAEPKVMLAGFDIDLAGQPSPFFTTAERTQLLAQAGDLLQAAQALNPAWAEIDRKLARLAAVSTPPDPAAERMYLTRAVAKDPMNFRARQELATLLVGGGDARGAYNLLIAGLGYPHAEDVTADYTKLLQQLAPLAARQDKLNP